jgi:hypothetical protein
VNSGTLIDALPFDALTENFSPMSRIAPPPFGSEMEGACKLPFAVFSEEPLSALT